MIQRATQRPEGFRKARALDHRSGARARDETDPDAFRRHAMATEKGIAISDGGRDTFMAHVPCSGE
jgi:hypothetical protein